MVEKDSAPPRRRRRWFPFLFGVVIGVLGAMLLPRYASQYVGDVLAPSAVVEGEVVGKESQEERILLKVTTPDGVLLASFTENQPDINLLVDAGDTIRLGAHRYQPFLENPMILSVREPADSAPDVEGTTARRSYQEEMEAHLRQWESKLKELEAVAARATDEAAQDFEPELDALREKRDALRAELSELESAGDVAWKGMKSGVDAAWSELERALAEARSKLADPDTSTKN